MKTQAAILFAFNTPLKITTLSLPKTKPGQVLIKMAYSGICRSQLNEMKGFKGPDKYLPHLLGHEGSGIVVDIGTQVKKVKLGDHVILSWIQGVGEKTPGSIFTYNNTRVNSGPITTFTQ